MLLKVNKSSNFTTKTRSNKKIQYLIVHYTGMQSERVSIRRLKDPKSRVSCHYFIARSGEIYRMVDDNKIAWHAGKSKWKNINNINIETRNILNFCFLLQKFKKYENIFFQFLYHYFV